MEPMTTATKEFEARSVVTDIVTPHLTAVESSTLLDCVNRIRSGEKVYLVRLTNRKVTRSRKRMPGDDYVADPALAPDAHEGIMFDAEFLNRSTLELRGSEI